MDEQEVVLLKKLSSPLYTLKAPQEVAITRSGDRITGRFKNLPLLLEAEANTQEDMLAQLGDGLVNQYEIVADQTEGFQAKIREACEMALQPVS